MLRRVSSVIFASFFTSAVARLMEESIARKRPSASSGGAGVRGFVARASRGTRGACAPRVDACEPPPRGAAPRGARSASRAASARRRSGSAAASRRAAAASASSRAAAAAAGFKDPAAGPATSAGAATSVRAAPAAARAAIAPPAAAAERSPSRRPPSPPRPPRPGGIAAGKGAPRATERLREPPIAPGGRKNYADDSHCTARRARSFAPALRVWRSEKPGQMAPLGSSSAPSRDTAADASDTRPSAPALARAHALARHRRHHGRHAFRLHLHRRASRRREARAGASASPRNATRRRAFFEPYRSRVKSEPPRVPPPAGPDRRDPKTSSREDRPRRERVSARALDPATAGRDGSRATRRPRALASSSRAPRRSRACHPPPSA